MSTTKNDVQMALQQNGTLEEFYSLHPNASGGRRAETNWQASGLACILSSGETTAEEMIAALKKKRPADSLPLVIDIKAMGGMFRNLHGEASIGALVNKVRIAAQQPYGTAGAAFIERLVADGGKALQECKESNILDA